MRALTSDLIRDSLRSAAKGDVLAQLTRGGAIPAPAALRVERSQSSGRRGERGRQTAVTLWFGEGPSLPGAGGGRPGVRTALRVGLGVGVAVLLAVVGSTRRLPSRVAGSPARRLTAGEGLPTPRGTHAEGEVNPGAS